MRFNPNGDPFSYSKPRKDREYFLFGLGLGLYWGEGTRASKSSVRLGNADPKLINTFIKFLHKIYGVPKKELTFGLQIFDDIKPETAMEFWLKGIRAHKSQFQKVVITPSHGKGTYRRKLENGVLTVYYHNTKLRNLINQEIEKLSF